MSDPSSNPFKASLIVDVNIETDRNDILRSYRVISIKEVIIDEDDDTSQKLLL